MLMGTCSGLSITGALGEDTFVDVWAASTQIYVVGNTNSPGLTNGIENMYILNFNSANGSLVWVKGFGGTAYDYSSCISIDSSNLYVGGYTASPGFSSTVNSNMMVMSMN